MKKLLIILSFLFASIGLKAQDLPPTPRVLTGQVGADSLGALRNGTKNDTLKLWSGFLFKDGTYLNSASLDVDSSVFATQNYVRNYADSVAALSGADSAIFATKRMVDSAIVANDPTYPDSSVLFTGADGKPITDSANFIWDNVNKELRIGSHASNTGPVAITLNTEAGKGGILVQRESDQSFAFFVDESGNVYSSPDGSTMRFTSSDELNMSFGSQGTGFKTSDDLGVTTDFDAQNIFFGGTINYSTSGNEPLITLGLIPSRSIASPASHSEVVRINARSTGNGSTTWLSITPTLSNNSNTKRGIYVNPTTTISITNFRAIESSNNFGHQFYADGNAPSYFKGKIGIGTTSPLDTLHVVGTARITTTPQSTSPTDSILVKDGTTGQVKAIPRALDTTVFVDFASIAASDYGDVLATVTGADTLMSVSIGVSPTIVGAGNISFTYWVSSSNTVAIRAHNLDTASPVDPPAAFIRIRVFR